MARWCDGNSRTLTDRAWSTPDVRTKCPGETLLTKHTSSPGRPSRLRVEEGRRNLRCRMHLEGFRLGCC